ncbi:MAG TPA: tetratricopeptide repeat protein [Deltaproteobacteria bacterium]|nr:tetratricopeptide repeat protein [Deltaproteobacteria bacterium]
MLAGIFESYDLPLAAIGAWARAIRLDPERAAPSVAHALDLSDATGEPRPVASALGSDLSIPVDAAVRNRLAYAAARYHLAEGSYGPALAILTMADSAQAGFEDVELLRGVVLSQQQRYTDAVAPMLTAEAIARKMGRDERFLNRANLNLARAYYAAGNYTQAITYYARVERSSEVWLEAQFERAWAHFRGNDTNGALALLFSHQSPFFEDHLDPEADLLRAYSLFVMCKFPDASAEIDAFQERWEPVQRELSSIALSPEEAFSSVRDFLQGRPSQLPTSLIQELRYEDRIAEAIRSTDAAEAQLSAAEALGGPAGQLAVRIITEQRDARIALEGERILSRLRKVTDQLSSMLTNIEITRIDLLSLETEMYQRAAATGVLDYGDHIGQLRDMRKRRRGFRVWPWQGEYWADEVGWYVFSARPDCPDTMAVGGEEP